MLNIANIKTVVMIRQEAATNAATLTSTQLDTLGYDYATIIVHGTTSNNATNNPDVFKLTELDTTVVSSFANVSGAVGDTDFTIPNSPTATTTAPFFKFNLDLRKRKRYITLVISPVTTQTFSAVALLARAEQSPVGTTAENVAGILTI